MTACANTNQLSAIARAVVLHPNASPKTPQEIAHTHVATYSNEAKITAV